jgi:hypothetical protein
MNWSLCLSGTTPWCLGWIAEKLLIPGTIAILIYRFAVLQLKRKRAIDFAEKQLAEFYAPMLGARAEILSHTKFDQYLRNASFREHSERLERAGRLPTSESLTEDQQYTESLKRFFGSINDRLLGERIDAYVAMRTLFAKKMAYADEDTRRWYEYFYSFVEMWRVTRDNERLEDPPVSRTTLSHLGGMFDERGVATVLSTPTGKMRLPSARGLRAPRKMDVGAKPSHDESFRSSSRRHKVVCVGRRPTPRSSRRGPLVARRLRACCSVLRTISARGNRDRPRS